MIRQQFNDRREPNHCNDLLVVPLLTHWPKRLLLCDTTVPPSDGSTAVRMIRTLIVLAFVSVGSDSNASSAIANQESAATSTSSVNVEIIVDASGSMAAETNTGELRIDSARRVLTEVINAIPEAEGVNVGLRVYGHRGDNTDEGRAESCLSSELLVPIDTVNKPELLAQVN